MKSGIETPSLPRKRNAKSSRLAAIPAFLKDRTEALGLFASCLALHAALTFPVLPPARFVQYQVAAMQVLDGTLPVQRFLDFSPLYLWIHVFARRLFNQPDLVVLWLQLSLTALCASLLFQWLAGRVGRAAALAAALVFVIHPGLIVYTATFEPEPLVMAALMGYLVSVRGTGRAAAVTGGCCLGLCLAGRANLLPLIVVTPLYYWLGRRNRAWRRDSLCFGLPVIVVLIGLTLRNLVLTGALMPFGMNPGTVFYEGNNPNSIGQSAVYPPLVYDSRADFPEGADYRHELYRVFAGRSGTQPLSVPEVNAYWTAKALAFITDHPGRCGEILLAKLTCVFHAFQRHDIWDIHDREKRIGAVLPPVSFALVSALALAGMAAGARTWKALLPAYAAFFLQVAVMLATYVSERQKMAILPLFFFFAAFGLHRLAKARKPLAAALGVVALACLLATDTDTIADERHLAAGNSRYQELMIRALVQRNTGDLATAATLNAAALAAAPWMITDTRLAGLPFAGRPIEALAMDMALAGPQDAAPARFDLGLLMLANGRLAEARDIFTGLAATKRSFNRRYHQSSLPAFYLARICALQHDGAGALAHLQQAAAANPGDPWVLAHLAVLTGREDYAKQLERYFGPIDTAFFIGQAAYDNHRWGLALEQFARVEKHLPEFRQVLLWRCLTLGRLGRFVEAAEAYARAMAMRPDHLFSENALLALFKDWVLAQPGNPAAERMLAAVSRDFGRSGGSGPAAP